MTRQHFYTPAILNAHVLSAVSEI